MSFSSYADLQTNIADWLARSDLTANIPDFITLFEAAAARRLQVRPMETSASLTFTNGSAPLPADYLATRSLNLSGYGELTYRHPAYLRESYPDSAAGIPNEYTIEGGSIKVLPTDDSGAFTLYYFAKNEAVSGSLNWLFTEHPDCYLAGSLCEAYLFCKDWDSAALWKARRDEIFGEIERQSFRNAASMAMKPDGAVV